MKYKFKEIDNIINILDGDNVIAKYIIDYHWVEKNISVKNDIISIRLYNRLKGYRDCIIKLNSDIIQKIPENEK